MAKSRKSSGKRTSARPDCEEIPHIEQAESLEEKLRGEQNPVKRFFGMLGPGLLTGTSDVDPSGIGAYAQAGASMGYAPLWLAWVSFPMMWTVQYMCAKIGMISGTGLAEVLRKLYSRPLLYSVVGGLAIANTSIKSTVRRKSESHDR